MGQKERKSEIEFKINLFFFCFKANKNLNPIQFLFQPKSSHQKIDMQQHVPNSFYEMIIFYFNFEHKNEFLTNKVK